MKKLFALSLALLLLLTLLGCSAIRAGTGASSYLTRNEVADIIKEDIETVYSRLESLITSPSGEAYIHDLRSIDLWWFPSLIWEENGVTITVRGDFSVDAVQIDDALIDTGKKAALEKAVTAAVAKAVKTAKDEAQAEMSKLAGGMGLGDLL